jgi:hypothetical protein
MKTKVIASLLFLCATFGQISFLKAQLPPEMYLSADGHILYTGGKPPSGLYDSAIIRRIDLNFSQSNYWQLLKQNYATQTEIPATMVVDGITYDSVGVRFKGETSYMQLPQNSQKTSFNVSVDFIHEDQRIMGYKTLNLHNCFQDASFMREVFYLHQIRHHIPAARHAYTELYINGANWGLYPSIQQLNKDFLEEWFLSNDGANFRADSPESTPGPGGGGWGDGTAALNYLGMDTVSYQKYYTLKSSDVADPWVKLLAVCNALNNTPANTLTTVLPQYMDVDRALWFIACEIAFADDDSYVHKGKMDYYAYWEPETGRLTPIEYDGNSVLNASNLNWGPFYNQNKVNYPLMNKLLAVPEYRQRYLAHLRTIINELLNPETTSVILENYKSQIQLLVQNDPKKLYPYQAFLNDVNALKNNVNTRRTTLLANGEVDQTGPAIAEVAFYDKNGQAWNPPQTNETVTVRAAVTHLSGLSSVMVYYSDQLTGNFTALPMYDDGLHNDLAAGDNVYGAELPGRAAGTWMRFYIEAAASTSAKTVSYMPQGAEHHVFVYKVAGNPIFLGSLVVNELMADNASTAMDEAGEYDDWIELFNGSDQVVNLGGYHLSDNPANPLKWQIPEGVSISPQGYLIFWADEDQEQGLLHTNFKLSKNGEVVILSDPQGLVVDSVAFGTQQTDMGYARVPNGTGDFVIQPPTFNASNGPVGVGSREMPAVFSGIKVYPNPAKNYVIVEMDEVAFGTTVELFNTLGQCIYKGAATQWQRIEFPGPCGNLLLLRAGSHTVKVMTQK